MKDKVIQFILSAGLWTTLVFGADVKDLRPSFDKRPYLKTCWTQANPWFLPDRLSTEGACKGGPDYAWHRYSQDHVQMWKKVAGIIKPYGMTGIQFELNSLLDGKLIFQEVMLRALEGLKQAGNGVKLMVKWTGHKTTPEKQIKQFDNLFRELWKTMKTHPNYYRLNGAPVLVVYSSNYVTAERWKKMIDLVEKKYGKIIILANAFKPKLKKSPEIFRKYMQVFDGMTVYANWTSGEQKRFYDMISDIMHNEFPQKIFEISVHNTYTVHYRHSGQFPELNEKYLDSWQDTLSRKPDSLTLTNFFDIYENSRIIPSYELDDIILRTAQFYLEKWRDEKVTQRDKIDIYVSNFTNVLLGKKAKFEVISFPVKNSAENIKITLQLCNAAGKILHEFPSQTFSSRKFKRLVFTVPTTRFIDELALLPRLKVLSGSYRRTTELFPPTMLAVGMRPHVLWWSRSLKNMNNLSSDSRQWLLNNLPAGSVLKYPEDSLAVIRAKLTSNKNVSPSNHYGSLLRIMRNGVEIKRIKRSIFDMSESLELPNPLSSLDWYSLEIVDASERRYLSAPIWVSGKRFGKKVKVPILDNDIRKIVTVNADRVPFFHYPCKMDNGPILLDRSGYRHNGYLGAKGYSGGHLKRTAYHFEQVGGLKFLKNESAPKFFKEGKGGFYRFSGKEHIAIQGGTAFPYSATYEIAIRPRRTGRKMTLLASMNDQVKISLAPDGKVIVLRSMKKNGKWKKPFFESKSPVEFDSWNRIAVVYDLKQMSLYIDGQFQGSMLVPPIIKATEKDKLPAHEAMNSIFIGSAIKNWYHPDAPHFEGDIKEIRIYGRNLSPAEFL